MTEDKVEEVELCEGCGKPEGTFACRIRHVQVNTGNLKRERESNEPNFGLTEQR